MGGLWLCECASVATGSQRQREARIVRNAKNFAFVAEYDFGSAILRFEYTKRETLARPLVIFTLL